MNTRTWISVAAIVSIFVIAGCGGGDDAETVACHPPAIPNDDIGAAEKKPLLLDRSNLVEAGDALLMQMQILQMLRWQVRDLDKWFVGRWESPFGDGEMKYTGCLAEDHTGIVRLEFTRYNFPSFGLYRDIEVHGAAVLIFHGRNDYTFIPESLSFDNDRHVAEVKGEARVHIGFLATSNLSFTFGSETWNARAFEMDEVRSVEAEGGMLVSFTGRIEQAGAGYLDATTQVPTEGLGGYGGFFTLAGANPVVGVLDMRDNFVGAVMLDDGDDGIEEAAARLATRAVERAWAENPLRGKPVAFAYAPTISGNSGQLMPKVLPGERVELSAALSIVDPEAVSYQWELWQRPLFSEAKIIHPTAVRPYFVADAPGNYIVAVHVTSKGETSTDLMNVNVASWWNEGYVITSDEGSGADIDAEVGSLVRVDPMIDSYHSTHGDWQLQSPLGSNTWVSGAHDASYQEFVPDKQGVYFLNGGLHISVDVAREYYAPFDSRHLLMNVVDLDGDGLEDRLYIEDERFLDSEDDPDILAVYSTEPTNPYLFKKDFGQWATLFELADLDDDGRKEIVTRRLLDENTMTLQVAFPAATLGSFKTPVETDAFVYDSDCGVSFHELRLPDGEPLLYLWSRNYGAHACPMPAYQAWKWNGSSLEPYTGTLDAEWFAGELIYLDFDNDDLTDVAVLDRHLGSTITLWRGQADNTYVNAGTLSDPNPVELTAGDVNGDGKDELVVASGIRLDPADYRGAQLFRDLDTTGFASRTILFDGNYDRSLYSPVLRDINDDGRKDFVVLQTGYSPHVVFAMQREDGTFEAPYTVPVDRSPHNGSLLTLHWFDINGDGEEDLIVGGRLVMFARPVD